MSDLDYLLVVLTHGDNAPLLNATLDSFLAHVSPRPSFVLVHHDLSAVVGDWMPSLKAVRRDEFGGAGTYVCSPLPLGFCGACRQAWELAVARPEPYVCWLEHDFDFLVDVDLRPLAAVLDAEPRLAQMGLMREPVNEREAAAGGLYALNRDRYSPRDGWLLSRTNFSTTCSLMRRAFMAERPWPTVDRVAAECEGVYSIELLEAGYEFAVWGDGTPQVRHTGVRTGWGY